MTRSAEVAFGILGPLRLTVDGRDVALTSPKQRTLLGVLLIDAGWVVSTDRLAEAMWGDDQPDDPSGAVHTHVSRLRSLLRRHGVDEPDGMLATRPPGYALAVAPEQVDAGRFERLVGQARAAPEPQTTADLLDEAIGLWRGRPFMGFDHELARVEGTRLEELRVSAHELWADALLALGRDGQVAAELEAVVARNPLREPLRGQLMVAMVRSGRRSDALATYRDLRDLLIAELGMEPSTGLRRLERAILQGTEDLPWPAPAREVDGVPPVGAARRPGRHGPDPEPQTANLPEPLTSFVGRQQDIRDVTAALRDGRVVALTGPAGVGKSRLAIRVARGVAQHYPDGVRLCELVVADDFSAVADVVATTLGVLPADGGTVEDALVGFLRTQRLLLVLDNCEHVRDGAAELVERIVQGCRDVDVLVTSRQLLGVAGEQVWPVRPLEVGDGLEGTAVALFCDRALAVEPTFELGDDDRRAVMEICQRLDGLPLAVELAAAWMRSMTPADIADRLHDRYGLLTRATRAAAPRHRSLDAAIAWSHDLLPAQARRLFGRLAVFAGGFDGDAAEHVCAGDGLAASEVRTRLAELVDHSLVAVDRSGRHARYRLLETLRAYASARLEDDGARPVWQRRHAEHFAGLAEQAATGLHGREEARWVHVVDAEIANLRAAHAWSCADGEVDLALRLAGNLRVYAYFRLRDEVYDWALEALQLPGAAAQPAHAAALLTAGVGWLQRGQLERARDCAEQVLAAASAEAPGLEAAVLRAHRLLAEVALYQGRLEDTDRHARDVIDRARAVGSAYEEALAHLYASYAAAFSGRHERAVATMATGRAAAEAADNPSLRAGYHALEGEVWLEVEPRDALRALRQAVPIARSVGNRFIEGVARVAEASLAARHGQPHDALVAFAEIVEHWRRSGDWTHMWTTLRNLLVLLGRIGADVPAAVLLGAVETATTGAPTYGADAERLDAAAGSLHASLGEAAFAEARARGRGMRDEDAVAYALREIDRLLTEEPAAVP